MRSNLLNHISWNTSIINESIDPDTFQTLITSASSSYWFESFLDYVKSNMPKTVKRYGVPLSAINDKILLKSLFGRSKLKKDVEYTRRLNAVLSPKSTVSPIIYTVPDLEPNAFTVLGLYSELSPSKLSLPYILYGNHPSISASIVDSKVHLVSSSGKNISPILFKTSSLTDYVKPWDQRLAIFMHELGHWDISAKKSSKLGSRISSLSTPILFSSFAALLAQRDHDQSSIFSSESSTLNTIMIIGFISMLLIPIIRTSLNRKAEFQADAFAKDLGFGKSLANALRGFHELGHVDTKRELKELSTISDRLSVFTDLFSSHPSEYRRSSRLLESTILESNIDDAVILNIVSKLDDMISKSTFIPELAIASK